MMDSKILTSCLVVIIVFIALAQSAPNNSTIIAVPSAAKNGTAIPSLNNTTSTGNNASSSSSEEDCDVDTGAGSKSNSTKSSGQREGKQLNPSDKDMYKHEDSSASKTNATSNASSPGDAEKLQGNTTTTTSAPATGGSVNLAPLVANVIFATIISSFTYSSL